MDFFNDFQETLADMLKNALSKGDTETLMGLEGFDSPIDYTGNKGMEELINVLFRETIESSGKAKEIRTEIRNRPSELYSEGLLAKKERDAEELENGYILIERIQNACKGLKQYSDQIDWLQHQGFIGGYARHGTNVTHLFLPKDLWGQHIDFIRSTGKETKIFGSAMGTMMGLAYSNRGFSSLKPTMLACSKADKTTGEITRDDFIECCNSVSKPMRFFSNLIERDQEKDPTIRFFKSVKDKKIIININCIRAYQQWHELANKRAIERTTAGE